MRAIWGLLTALLLLGGQVHVCQGVFLCPDGNVCPSCRASACPDKDQSARLTCETNGNCDGFLTQYSDCTKCCELTACPEESYQSFDKAQPPIPSPVAFIEPVIEVPRPEIVPIQRQVELQESTLPHGPPGTFGSRAPPANPV